MTVPLRYILAALAFGVAALGFILLPADAAADCNGCTRRPQPPCHSCQPPAPPSPPPACRSCTPPTVVVPPPNVPPPNIVVVNAGARASAAASAVAIAVSNARTGDTIIRQNTIVDGGGAAVAVTSAAMAVTQASFATETSAVDRDFLAKDIYSGSQLPSYSMVPPGMANYAEPAKADFSEMSQLDREDEAVKLMKEAGYGEGGKPLKIEIRYNTNPNHERVATAVADMWKNTFGAEVSMVNLDVSSHYAYLQEGGKFNVARAGWVADYADPENFLALSVGSNKTFNYGHFENAEFDGLMKKSYEEIDPTKRAKILHDAETLLMKEQPIAPFLTQADLWLVSDRVKGWQDNAANQHLSKFLSIAE